MPQGLAPGPESLRVTQMILQGDGCQSPVVSSLSLAQSFAKG